MTSLVYSGGSFMRDDDSAADWRPFSESAGFFPSPPLLCARQDHHHHRGHSSSSSLSFWPCLSTSLWLCLLLRLACCCNVHTQHGMKVRSLLLTFHVYIYTVLLLCTTSTTTTDDKKETCHEFMTYHSTNTTLVMC